MTCAERVHRYRRLAQSAVEQAQKHGGEIGLSYLRLAEQWGRLAKFAEATDAMGGLAEQHPTPDIRAAIAQPIKKPTIGNGYFLPPFWTALFTGVRTWSTVQLWREIRRLADGAEIQAKDTKESIAVAKRSADAAMAAQRAWLDFEISSRAPLRLEPDGIRWSITVKTKNIGKSPAAGIRAYCALILNRPNNIDLDKAILRARALANESKNPAYGYSLFPDQEGGNNDISTLEIPENEADIEALRQAASGITFSLAVHVEYRVAAWSGVTERGFLISGHDQSGDFKLLSFAESIPVKDIGIMRMPMHDYAA